MSHSVSNKVAALFAMPLLLGQVFAADVLFQNVAIINSTEQNSYPQADVLVIGDQIVEVGENLVVPNGIEVIDGAGKVMTSGLFNSNTQIGLREISAVANTVDARSENQRITASLKIVDAFNPRSVVIPHNRMFGLTHTLLQPSVGLSLFSGIASVVNLSDTDSIEVRDAAMVITLGESGSSLSGGSRAATLALLREAIEDARDYAANKNSYNSGKRRDYPLSRQDLESLIPVVQGRLPLLVNVERAADIERVLIFAKRHKLSLILAGVSEGWLVADKIAEAQVPVIFDPINNLPSSYETLGARLDNAKLMDIAGVTLLFTGMGWQNTHNAYLVRQSAGNAVANGLPYHKAIQAITSNPAKIFGLPGYGEIRSGAQASLVLWSGDPLEVTSNAELVMINGKPFDLSSRATRLRDRYFERLKR